MKFADFLNEVHSNDNVKIVSSPKLNGSNNFVIEFKGEKYNIGIDNNGHSDMSDLSRKLRKTNYVVPHFVFSDAEDFIKDSDVDLNNFSSEKIFKDAGVAGVIGPDGKLYLVSKETLTDKYENGTENYRKSEEDFSFKSSEKKAIDAVKLHLLNALNDAASLQSGKSEGEETIYNEHDNIKGGISIQFNRGGIHNGYTVENSLEASDEEDGDIMLKVYTDIKDVKKKREHFYVHGYEIIKLNGKKYSVYEKELVNGFAE